MKLKPILFGILCFSVSMFVVWYGGADLLERNILNAYFLLVNFVENIP